jgi:hypothetical protein
MVLNFALLIGLLARPAIAATPQQVEAALGKAKDFLYSKQGKDGTWEKSPTRNKKKDEPDWMYGQDVEGGQWGGQTALAVFALLVAGEDPQGPQLAPAVDFLMKADLIGTYALGMRAQVLMLLPQTTETKNLMRKDATRLTGLMQTKGKGRGFYNYTAEGTATSLSRAQYAVLGVWSAAQSGQEISTAYWAEVEKAWVGAQEADGGWRYQPGRPTPEVTAGITAVGVATLFIVQDQLYANRGVDCKNPLEIPAIQKGIDWMAKNFDKVASETKYPRDFPNATLYAVERVGVAGGLKYFGKHDWYEKGADYLIKRQAKSGSWAASGFSAHSDTCFAIVFLSRGRAPVIINKLDWVADDKAAAGAWNRRPRDIANVTRWIGRTTERDLNWQIMSLDAPMEDWHDAPILYLAGSDPLKIGKEHQQKMKQFAENGGLILIHADCGRGGFVGSARNLANAMFPTYEFRELPAEHPIYTTLYPRTKWKTKPSVMGVSNGARELLLLIPTADPAKNWQLNVTRERLESWELAANIVFYAADQKDLRFKGDTHLVAADPAVKTTTTLALARLKYKGNWDPEPGGWRRLKSILHNADKLDLTVQTVELGAGPLDKVKVAHLTGTTRFKLDDAAKAQLKKFVADGGTLLIDAAGGAEAFASSIEPDLESLGPGAKLEPLPPEHSLFGGMKITYRPYAQKHLTGKANVPHLKVVRAGDRPAIVFSREDLSAGMVGHSVGGIVGYQPAVATELVRRIILKAAGLPMPTTPAATTAPATKPLKKKSQKAETAAKPDRQSTPAEAGDGL